MAMAAPIMVKFLEFIRVIPPGDGLFLRRGHPLFAHGNPVVSQKTEGGNSQRSATAPYCSAKSGICVTA
jgi:hypothetical protein